MAPQSRRRFLQQASALGLMLPFGAAACGSGGGSDAVRTSAGVPVPERFTLPFKRPARIRPSSTEGNTCYFDVRAYSTDLEILPGVRTPVFSYNGTFPGPAFEVRRGCEAVVRTRNDLALPIATHLHGSNTSAASDGYPTDLILPASGWTPPEGHGTALHEGMRGGDTTEGSREYRYPNAQRAAGLWYHDHRMDFTGPQVWRGLAGTYTIRDDEEDALPLPKGEREIPIMIMDRAFASDGSFAYPSRDPRLRNPPGVKEEAANGMTGDVILINGVPWPRLEVKGARYRLRLLNASNARRYRVRFDPEPEDGEPFTQIGSDAGLLEKPQPNDSLYMVPGERFDIVVDFGVYPPGTKVTLTNSLGDGPTEELMQFVVGDRIKDDTRVPSRLSTVERLDPADAVRTRSFRFAHIEPEDLRIYQINGKPFSTEHIWADPKLGQTEIWEFESTTHHPVHIHHSPFQVYRRDGSDELEPEDVGWKDTVRLQPRETLSLLVHFTGEYTGKFVFHCHNLEHEDMAMMANFQLSQA